ncbi:MAG: carboxypeptidase regulatory-like domain-containing protein [Myxococcota bacterium]
MSSDSTPRWIGLALVAVVAALALGWWLSHRPSSDPAAAEPVTAAEQADGPRSRRPSRPPPPRRLGPIDAPRASAHPSRELAAGALVGEVRSWLDDAPVPEAELTFQGEHQVVTALTGEDGSFTLEVERPGPYTLLSVLADGYRPYAPMLGQAPLRYVSREGQRVEGATIVLMPEVEIDGEVHDAEGRPAPGAQLRWLGVGTGETALAPDDREYRSDSAGRFHLAAQLGAWLEARHETLGVGRAQIDERALVSGTLVITLNPRDTGATERITGRVLDPGGKPAEGAKVLAQSSDGGPGAEAVSEADGSFELFDLPPGKYRVEARLSPYAPVWASNIATDSHGLVLQLAGGGTITGTLRTEDGEVVPGATVAALRHVGPLLRTPQGQTTIFDADGEFRLDGLPPGTYDVAGGAADHSMAWARGVELGSGTVELELVLPAGGQIQGVVRDASGSGPIASARVEVERGLAAGPSVAPLRSSAVTDDRGAFTIRGVEPGRHSVHVSALGYAPRSLSGLEVEAGQTLGPIDIDLSTTDAAGGQAFDIVGIGVMVRVDGDVLAIVGLVESGGAATAGLKADDRIVRIDGVAVVELLGFGEAVQALRGREGTEVMLKIERAGSEPFEVGVIRSRIRG